MENGREMFNEEISNILKCVKRGDTEKMDEVFTKTYNHFYGYALIKLKDEKKTEDAVMQMYENVLRYIGSFNVRKNGMGWMFAILNNIINKIFKKEKRIKKHEIPLIDENISIEELNKMYDNMGLSEAISNLDDVERKIIFWHYFERRTLAEIAKRLGLSVSAIHKRICQIKEKIKKLYDLSGK